MKLRYVIHAEQAETVGDTLQEFVGPTDWLGRSEAGTLADRWSLSKNVGFQLVNTNDTIFGIHRYGEVFLCSIDGLKKAIIRQSHRWFYAIYSNKHMFMYADQDE